MSKSDTEAIEALDLDRRWDALNATDPAIRQFDRGDQELRELVESDNVEPPSLQFVAELWSNLRADARRIGPVERDLPVAPLVSFVSVPYHEPLTPPRVVVRRRRMRGLSRVGKVASVLLAASLLIAMLAAVARYPFTSSNGTGAPTIVSPGEAIPDVPMPGADPGRTNVQPGPALTMLPKITQRSTVAGQAMALSGNTLVIVSSGSVTALDANTLDELWSVNLGRGSVSEPTIANGTVFLGYLENSESGFKSPEDSRLVALTLADGSQKWAVSGAGAMHSSPLVVGGVVYSLGYKITAGNRISEGDQIGAYRAVTGEVIWQRIIWRDGWCCFPIGFAFADGLLAINAPLAKLTVIDAGTGADVWSADVEPDHYWNVPTIGDGMVYSVAGAMQQTVTNTSESPIPGASPTENNSAIISAFDLKTGTKRWSNDSAHAYLAFVSYSSGHVLYDGGWGDAQDGVISISAATGKPEWIAASVGQSDKMLAFTSGANWTAPASVDRTVFGISTTPGSNGSNTQVAALDVATGSLKWAALLDGTSPANPIVSGSRIFILTYDAGLYVLGDDTVSADVPGTVVDLRTPVVCTVQPSDSPMLGDLPDTPTRQAIAPWSAQNPFYYSQIPAVQGTIDPALADQLVAFLDEYRACSYSDPYHGVFGFFTTDFYVRLKSVQEYWGTPEQPWAVWMAPTQALLTLQESTLGMMPDGRIGGFISGGVLNICVWFAQDENGAWKIDEYHRVIADPVDPNAATPPPSTNADGTPLG